VSKKFRHFIYYIILVLAPFILWLTLEFALNKLTQRFEPLKTDKEKQSLYLNQDYFNDFFIYNLPAFYTTSTSNRAIHLEKNDRFRIFCLGGSTTAGYPYNTFPQFSCPSSFPNYLRAILQYNKNIPDLEILNAGCNALNSYNILQVFKDLKKYDPDLIIVYTGHNEFFGPNEFALPKEKALLYYNQSYSGILFKLRRTFLYQGLRWFIRLFSKKSSSEHQDYLSWSKKNYVLHNDPINDVVKANFQKNLKELVKLAKDAGIKLVLCTPVSNWTFPPFISKHSRELSRQETVFWDSLTTQAKNFYQEEKYKEALHIWTQLKDIDSTYADIFYQAGKAYTKLNMYGEAAYELWRAKDLDALPFRAKSFVTPIIREIAINENIILADLEQFYIQLSNRLIPNQGLLLEHLHPTEAGYYYMALHIAQVLVKNKVFKGVTEIEFPEIDKCREVLNILDFVVDRIEFDLANESYLERLSDLNPEIKGFLAQVRNRAYAHAQAIGQELVREMNKEKQETEQNK